jgi:hypothetical protein
LRQAISVYSCGEYGWVPVASHNEARVLRVLQRG